MVYVDVYVITYASLHVETCIFVWPLYYEFPVFLFQSKSTNNQYMFTFVIYFMILTTWLWMIVHNVCKMAYWLKIYLVSCIFLWSYWAYYEKSMQWWKIGEIITNIVYAQSSSRTILTIAWIVLLFVFWLIWLPQLKTSYNSYEGELKRTKLQASRRNKMLQ